MAARGGQVAAALVLLQVLSYGNAAILDILPAGDVQIKPIGSSLVFTCVPNVDNPSLISQLEWRDPQNRLIERLGNVQGNSKPPMYTEVHQNTLALFVNDLQEDQGGNYSCKANYANTEDLSKNVTIQTIVGITWDDAPTNQYPILGEDFSIKCKVRARPSPSVDWLYNGDLITTNDHYIIETHALKIKNVQESDDGVYTCRAYVATTGELDVRAIRVEVHVKPVVNEFDSEVEIIEGENANIRCVATGKPPPKFTWIKSLTQQNLASADRFGVDEDTGILTITNVNRDDAGEYQCTATNAAGRGSAVLAVTVVVKPKIMEFVNVTAPVEKKAIIKCKAFGRPPPLITFRKHTSDKAFVSGVQPSDDRITLSNEQDDLIGETTATLTIESVLRSDDGLYECMARNKGGDAWKTGHLTAEFPPSFASTKSTWWSWDQKPVNLTCIAESIPNATIRWQLSGYDVDNDPQIRTIGKGPISTLTIVPLDKRHYGTYKCIASNIHGTRDYSITLREAYRPLELLQARIAEITATTIKFNLTTPHYDDDFPIKSITVQYKEADHIWAKAMNKTWALNSPYILEGLRPETTYDFRFNARNEVGDGNWGTNIHETTPRRSFPNEPKVMYNPGAGLDYELSKFKRQFELRWSIPADNGEPIDLYEVRWCQIERVNDSWQVKESTCTSSEMIRSAIRSSYWIKNLQPETFYKAEVKAHNKIGYSTPGSTKFKTAAGQNPEVMPHDGPLISSAAIIGIVIAALFLLIVVIDVICCCASKTGIIFYVCERSRRKPVDEDDAKLGREEKEPLREEKKITPIIDSGLRRETSVNFNGKTSVSKTGFVGKDSAV